MKDDLPGKQKLPLVLIVGPTAVGKTELAIRIAESLNGEIISADSRLFYRGMDVGTAKPTAAEMRSVPHHLIDIVNPDETISLTQFKDLASQCIEDIHARGKLPFLVGGTGQYVRAISQGWVPPEVSPHEKLRAALEKLAEERGTEWLHAKLSFLDPEAGQKIESRNLRRTIRAFEVIFSTGKHFSAQRILGDPDHQLITIGLTRPRSELYQRVDQRIDSMFSGGLLDEVRGLLKKGYAPSLPSMSAIGYRECVRVIQGMMTTEEARAEMKRITRVFVRRQANWFKESDEGIRWFNPGAEDVEDEIRTHIRNSIQP